MKLFSRSRSSDPVILVSSDAGSTDCLVYNQEPVWPIAAAEDLATLNDVARTFAATITEVAGSSGQLNGESRETVCAIGESLDDEARLYAHLTGRRATTVADVGDLQDEALPDVILLVGRRLDPALVQRLMLLPSGSRQPGIVWGRTAEELHLRVLAYSAASRCRGRHAPVRRADLVSDAPVGVVQGRRRMLLGGRATADDILNLLNGVTGVFTILCHGEARMIKLSSDLAFCMRHDPPERMKESQVPYCVDHGYCTAVNRSFDEAIETQLLDPEVLSARLLLLPSCRMVPIGSSAVDSEWAVLPLFLTNASIGAVIASPELVTTQYSILSHELASLFEAGVPVAEAMEQFERAPRARLLGQRLLLFGDPRTCAAPRVDVVDDDEPPGVDPLAMDLKDPAVPVPLQMMNLLSTVQRRTHPDSADTALALGIAVNDAAVAMERGVPLARSHAALRRTTLAHVTTLRARTVGIVGCATAIWREEDPIACPGCGWMLRPFRWEVGDIRRQMITCPRCVEVLDAPESSTLNIHVELPRIELLGDFPDEPWDGAAYISPAVHSRVQAFTWPAAADGTPERSLTLSPRIWPDGPLEVRVLLISDITMYSMGRTARAPAADRRTKVQSRPQTVVAHRRRRR